MYSPIQAPNLLTYCQGPVTEQEPNQLCVIINPKEFSFFLIYFLLIEDVFQSVNVQV